MKTMKSLALMTMGGLSVLAYQKYNKPMKRKISKVMSKMDEQLEDMM